MKQKFLTLLTLLLCAVTGVWADDTVLFSTDFTESGWSSLGSTSTAQTLTIGTQTVYVRANNTDNLLSVNTTTGTLTWGNRNFSNKDCYMAIPITGVNGSVTVKVYDGTSDTRVTYATSTSSTVANPSSTTDASKASPSTFTVSNIEGSFIMVYLGRQGSSLKTATSITITTPAPSCTSVAAPTDLTCSAQTSTSLTFSWTAAANASKYTATLYSDADCTSEVATQSNITTTSVTFSGLSASATYYCKVQSNGDGETYCEEGGVTSAVSGTTSAKAYTVTAASNKDEWGTAAAAAGSLDEGETTTVTATANSGYKFVSWAVSGTGASLSSTTTNPTTLTIGTANATVTATFRALESYTISYAAGTGDGITGSKADETKTEDEAFTLPSTAVFTRDGYVQTGWATSDGGTKAYDLGGSYETNAAQTFYPFWTAAYTLTFDANGGTGSMEAQQGVGSITLTANAYTKSGYTFIGWNTEADGTGTAYANGADYTLDADATLYAQWAENYFEFTPKSVTEDKAVAKGDVLTTTVGGRIIVAATKDASSIKYTTSGFALTGGGVDSLRVELNDYMQPGTVIVAKMAMGGTSAPRGLYINTTTAAHSRVALLGFASTGFENGQVGVFTYTVKADDGLAERKSFGLQRQNSVYLQSLTIVNCQPGATTTSTGWCTYSNNKALDLSTLTSGFTAYVAKEVNGDNNVIMKSTDAIVPANTGLMIKGTAGDKFTISATSADATFSGTNLLVAMPEGGTVTAANNTSEWNYVFGYEDEDNYGFYKINEETATLGLGKAYLHTTTALATAPGDARLGIVFDDEETTGIDEVQSSMFNVQGDFYDLQGRRVAQPAKGLYIVSGRKVVVK